MKKLRITLMLLMIASIFSFGSTACRLPTVSRPGDEPQVQKSFYYFYNALSSYGRWINIERFGHCWQPANMPGDWHPYFSRGHWAYTQYGWTWAATDRWGDIVFHYGSWYHHRDYGWVWVPGYNWAPAWVTWRYTDNYIGWAPLPPDYHLRIGSDIYDKDISVDNRDYVYVRANDLTALELKSVRLGRNRIDQIELYARPATTINIVNDYIVNYGPTVPALFRIKENPRPLAQIYSQPHRKVQPERISRERLEIQLTEVEKNRYESRYIITAPTGSDSEARPARPPFDRR